MALNMYNIKMYSMGEKIYWYIPHMINISIFTKKLGQISGDLTERKARIVRDATVNMC